MSFKKLILSLAAVLAGFTGSAVADDAEAKAHAADYNDHPAYNFHGQHDKTDIFAIPVDSSEEEVEEELESLEAGYPPKK